MTTREYILAAFIFGLILFVFYMAQELRGQRGRAMVAEQYARDVNDQLSHMMKSRTVEWDENDDSGMRVVTEARDHEHPLILDDLDDDWLARGVNPVRERGGQG